MTARRDSTEALEARLAKIDDERAQLQARLKAARAAETAKARKQRAHALMTIGGLVESKISGGWTAIDFDALAKLIAAHADEIAACGTHTNRSVEQATKDLREWEMGKKK